MKYETDGIQLGDKYYESTEALINGDGGSTGTPLKNIVIEEEEIIPGFYGKFLPLDSFAAYSDGTMITPFEDNYLPFSIKVNGISYTPAVSDNKLRYNGSIGVERYMGSDEERPICYGGSVGNIPYGGDTTTVTLRIIKNCSDIDLQAGNPIWGLNDCIMIDTGSDNLGTIELEYVNKPSV